MMSVQPSKEVTTNRNKVEARVAITSKANLTIRVATVEARTAVISREELDVPTTIDTKIGVKTKTLHNGDRMKTRWFKS
jgi:hypothetical protein